MARTSSGMCGTLRLAPRYSLAEQLSVGPTMRTSCRRRRVTRACHGCLPCPPSTLTASARTPDPACCCLNRTCAGRQRQRATAAPHLRVRRQERAAHAAVDQHKVGVQAGLQPVSQQPAQVAERVARRLRLHDPHVVAGQIPQARRHLRPQLLSCAQSERRYMPARHGIAPCCWRHA